MDTSKIIPVVLGADLNCYHIARSFHEQYGVRTAAFGRYAIGATKYTKIIDFTAVPDLDTPETAVRILNDFAAAHRDNILIALGCTDDYVDLLSQNKDKIDPQYIVPYIDFELMDRITHKEYFYDICKELDIPYPNTVIFKEGDTLDNLPFGYPIIIKPSVSAPYWHHPFEGIKKVFVAESRKEADEIIGKIYGAGYPEHLIIQDMIPGDDSHMYVLTTYSDRDANVRMMCLGHVLLEEHTPKGRGNHCAIVTEDNHELYARFKKFLEHIHYTGFANFDIKYDERDGSFRAFEINTRLGRSSYYITAAGQNSARWYVEDRVEKKDFDGCIYNKEEIYWRYIPDSVVFTYIHGELADKVRSLIKSGKAYSSMRYPFDLKGNPKRRVYVMIHEHRHIKKFKTYYHPETNV